MALRLIDIYTLLVKGQSVEQIKEAIKQKSTYSGEEVTEFLEAVVKRIDNLEAKIGLVGEINYENLEKIKEELRQKAGTLDSIKMPKDTDECALLVEKAKALEQRGRLKEAGGLYLICDIFKTKRYDDLYTEFLSFCKRQKDKLQDARFIDQSDLLLKCINEKKTSIAITNLLKFYPERAEMYEQFSDKESAEKDRKELQKILGQM